jgi:hypothetical protein
MKLSRLTIPGILTLVLVICIISCTGKATQKNVHTGVEYYRNLQFSETPYDIEKGTYPINAINSHMISRDDFYQLNL